MSDKGRLLNEIANKEALAKAQQESKDRGVREDGDRHEQMTKNLRYEVNSRNSKK